MSGDPAPDEFYIGWSTSPRPRLSRFLRLLVVVLLGAGLGLAGALATAQAPFAPAVFEFGKVGSFEGVLGTSPVPMLHVERPGGRSSSWLLVAPGKWGAHDAVEGLDGHRVRLEGTLIHRDGHTMVELSSAALVDLGPAMLSESSRELGEVVLEGEIVDSKCFLGVMNPGNLKPHRACAVRCISGGIPPMLLVREGSGQSRQLLLVGPGGESIGQAVLPYVAEPVRVSGRLSREGEHLLLRADPGSIERL